MDKAGHIGPVSSTKSGKTKPGPGGSGNDSTPPAQVTGLTINTVSTSHSIWRGTKTKSLTLTTITSIASTTSGFSVTPGVTQPAGTSTANSYSSTGLSPSTKYSYRVAAVDNAGNIGPLSSQVSKTTASLPPPADTTPPAQVTGLTINTVSTSQLNLAWNQNQESDFNHYNIYRGTTSGFSVTLGQPAGTSTANSYSGTGLSPSTTYYYKVGCC